MNSTLIPDGNAHSVAAGLVNLLRPSHWIKNGFVLAPLVFAGQFTDMTSVMDALLAMFFFCLAASATYTVNDYHDIEHDRRHPLKSAQRPLASGQVSKVQALVLLGVLYGVLLLGFLWQPEVMLVILGYLGLNLLYTFILKHQPVIDIFTVAIGFVLRVYAGAVALSVPVSSWMFVTTLCLALYLAAVKRRQELVQTGNEGRKVLEHYSVALIDRYAEMSATGALLFYSLFVITAYPDRPELIITIPFVLYGLFRYWFVVESLGSGDSPTDALLSDWQLAATVLFWIAASVWTLWSAGGGG
ncbi:MAG: decaprenyl-phosphate phosphoribosyltransferase [Pseudohongiellaceae bacterium]